MEIADTRQKGVIPELDGTRGTAILLVLIFHSYLILPIPSLFGRLRLGYLIGTGWSGVDLFFVLSGFLISGILLDSLGSRNFFSSFYARRILRIFPLYFVTVLCYFHIALPLVHDYGGPRRTDLDTPLEWWFWFHLANWPIARGMPAGWLEHLWSLAIEEQFYLCWPLVIFFAGRRWMPWVSLALMGVSFASRCVFAHGVTGFWAFWFIYKLTPFRVEPLALGSLAACAVRSPAILSLLRKPHLLVLIASAGGSILLAVLWTGRDPGFAAGAPMVTFGYTSLALIYVSGVLYAHMCSGASQWLATVLRSPLLRTFGKYSYGIYVLHVPVYRIFGIWAKRVSALLPRSLDPLAWIIGLAIAIGLSFGVALISWNLLEKHFWRMKRRFPAAH